MPLHFLLLFIEWMPRIESKCRTIASGPKLPRQPFFTAGHSSFPSCPGRLAAATHAAAGTFGSLGSGARTMQMWFAVSVEALILSRAWTAACLNLRPHSWKMNKGTPGLQPQKLESNSRQVPTAASTDGNTADTDGDAMGLDFEDTQQSRPMQHDGAP